MSANDRDRKRDAQPGSVRFGDFRLLHSAQHLSRHGEEIRLEPKMWDALEYLVARAGELVSKEALLAAVWPDVVVSDAALTQTMLRLRAALGDDARKPRYIETVHRRGYRFIAPLVAEGRGEPWAATDENDAFVGRLAELERLAVAVAEVEQRRWRVVLVGGDLGVGKTALVDRFLGTLPAAWRVARGQCIEQYGAAEPFMPVLTAFEQMVRGSDQEIVAVLRRYAPTWLAQMPWLADEAEARSLREQLLVGTRPRMLREMAAALGALAEDRGLLLVVEDLHWCDPATLDLLAVVAQRPGESRLMVLGNFRAAEAVAHGHPVVALSRSLDAKGQCISLNLESLTRDEVRAFLERRFLGSTLPGVLTDGLFEQTDGNPFFLEAIVGHLVETGRITRDAAGWKLTEAFDAADRTIVPSGLRQMIETVLDRVDADDRALLETASVIGPTFAAAALVEAGPDAPADLELVESTCERLVRRCNVLQAATDQRRPDGTRTARYRFRHELYRSVLYDGIAPSRRRRLHQTVGERLEAGQSGGQTAGAAELAVHFSESGDDARAVRYLLRAAYDARSRLSDREAEAHLSAALRRLPGVPAGPERDLGEALIRVNRSLLRVLTEGSGPDMEEEESLQRVGALLESMPDRPELFPLLRELYRVQTLRCQPAQTGPLAERLSAVAEMSGRLDRRAEGALAKGHVDLIQGRPCAALENLGLARQHHLKHGAGTAGGGSAAHVRSRDLALNIVLSQARALTLRGRLDDAVAAWEATFALCNEGPLHPVNLAGTRFCAAEAEGLLGNLAAAGDHNAAGLALAEEHQLLAARDSLGLQRAWIDLACGSPAAEMPALRDQMQLVSRSHPSIFHPVTWLYFVKSCVLAEAPQEGLDLLAALREDCAARGVAWYDAEMVRLEAHLLLLRDGTNAFGRARALLQDAIALAAEQGAMLFALRAAATWIRMAPDDKLARTRLGDLYAGFGQRANPPLLQEAARLLGRKPRRPANR